MHKEGNFSMSEKKVREKKKPTFFLLQINQVIKGMIETISSSTIPLISLDINRVMSLSSSSSQKTASFF